MKRSQLVVLGWALACVAVAALSSRGMEPDAAAAQAKTQWIWATKAALSAPKHEEVFLRTVVRIGKKSALKSAAFAGTCDNLMTVFVNGKKVGSSSEWSTPVRIDILKHLRDGDNVVAVHARNQGGPAGFCAQVELTPKKGKRRVFGSSGANWLASTKKIAGWSSAAAAPDGMKAAANLCPLGQGPWNAVNLGALTAARQAKAVTATPVSAITTLPGFQVELIYTVPRGQQGSWVSLCVDPKGRLIAGDQGGGLYRITPPPPGAPASLTKVEKLDVPSAAGGAHGLLWAFDSLYVVRCEGREKKGLYRCKDTNGDDQLDEVKLLREFRGGGEHGPHSVILSPDGKSLYVCGGNHTEIPNPETSTVPRVWKEDLLLPRQWDARGHARGRLAPGGWIAKTDPEGKSFELTSIGYRNQFDIAFNRHGDLFTYDADMEWDVGTPWYRPTRVNHATSGSEFGWRSGTGKWPTYYPDNLGSVVDVGPGSPTGIAFGYGAKFPRKYQDALYICDWSYGKMYAVHLSPDGSSYTGELEQFVSASPLPLTDLVVRPQDGALYFAIGGRGTQSGLYRVQYVKGGSAKPPPPYNAKISSLRNLRKSLEALHGGPKADALDKAWPHLDHEDRAIRFAARVAVEHQPVGSWRERVLAENRPRAIFESVIALARHGSSDDLVPALERLQRHDWRSESKEVKLGALRALQLCFIRLGKPSEDDAKNIGDRLNLLYPSGDVDLDRELSRLVVYLEADDAAEKTLKLLETAPTQEEQIHYAFCLRDLKNGWTLEQRKRFFSWFQTGRAFRGGASFDGFIRNIKNETVGTLSGADKEKLAEVLKDKPKPDLFATLPKPKGPGKTWTVADLAPIVESKLEGRSFENGKSMFAAAQCFLCHRFDGKGGSGGPDLTGVGGRFSVTNLLESIVEPSKVISDQYRATTFVLNNGTAVTGRIVNMGGNNLNVNTDMTSPGHTRGVNRGSIVAMQPSDGSMLPASLLDRLNAAEVADLVAYLLSRGDPNAEYFKK